MMFTKRLFSPHDIFRCSASNACGLEAARRFRQDGVVIVENFLASPVLHLLSESCAAAAKARGRQVFPAVDPEHSGALQFDMQVKPKATAKLGELPPPEDLKKVIEDNDAKKALDRHVRKVELKCKTQRKVDRLYRQLSKQRNRWHKLKQIPTVLTEKEELSGDITDERIEEVKKQFTYEQVKSSFEKYRDDGKMELEIRRDNHIDETLQYLENWGRFWIGFWSQLPLSVREVVGEEVGKAAAFLCGEVAIRLYVDTLQEFIPLTNGVPFHCSASGLNFRHPSTVNFFLQLQHSSEDSNCSNTKGLSPEVGTDSAITSSSEDVWTRMIVVPGSHQAIYDITNKGEDFTSLQHQHVLDSGYLMRNTPELQQLPIVEVPRLSPGSALIMSAYLVNSSLPTLQGSLPLTPFCFPTQHTSRHPDLYQLTLMPDHCRFDGLRNSWFSKDTHGPLYHYKEGQLLTDESKFPLLYRALDIE